MARTRISKAKMQRYRIKKVPCWSSDAEREIKSVEKKVIEEVINRTKGTDIRCYETE